MKNFLLNYQTLIPKTKCYHYKSRKSFQNSKHLNVSKKDQRILKILSSIENHNFTIKKIFQVYMFLVELK